MFSVYVSAAGEAEEDEDAGDEEGEVAERRRNAELGGNQTAEAAAFEGLAVEDVDVVEGVGGEAEQQGGGDERAEAGGARDEKKEGGGQLRADDSDGRGPDPMCFDEVGEVESEVPNRVELRADREQEERRQAEAADVDEQIEERTASHLGNDEV